MQQSNILDHEGYQLKKENVTKSNQKGNNQKRIKCRLYVSKKDIKEAKKRKRVKRKISDTPPPNNHVIQTFFGFKYVDYII